jgi:hypothetical protein
MLIKNFLKFFVIVICMITISSTAKSSSIIPLSPIVATTNTITGDSLRVLEMEQRVREIQTMDLQNLSPLEKKNLRNELKHINKEARAISGVYISVGSLIIIILLLIIILR